MDISTYNLDSKVKYISSEMLGTPVLKNEFGSLNNLLKKVLTEGFNTRVVSAFNVNIEEQIATLTVPLNHGYTPNNVVSISGASEEFFNGQFRVLDTTGTTVTIGFSSAPERTEASTATEITISLAPLGYTLAYENEVEGVLCFKNKSLKSPAILKSIDKLPPNGYNTSWAKYTRVVIGQNIDSDGNFVNNIKTPHWVSYPDSEYSGNKVSGAGGIHGFAKWDYAIHNNYDFMESYVPVAGNFPTDWRIIGDDKTFYLMIRAMGKNRYSYNVLGFGNYVPDNKKETFNICLQARYGAIAANNNWYYNFLRSGNNFGALDWDYSGFLYASIYGNVINQSRYGIYRCVGLCLATNYMSQPWRSTVVKGLLPYSGTCITSLLYIKDSDNYIRGHHRGVRIFYGDSNFTDNFTNDIGDLVLSVQAPMNESSSENEIQQLLFSLKDWEEV